jgi:hypothetical protein
MSESTKKPIFKQIELARSAVQKWDSWRRETAHFATAVGQSATSTSDRKKGGSTAAVLSSSTKKTKAT